MNDIANQIVLAPHSNDILHVEVLDRKVHNWRVFLLKERVFTKPLDMNEQVLRKLCDLVLFLLISVVFGLLSWHLSIIFLKEFGKRDLRQTCQLSLFFEQRYGGKVHRKEEKLYKASVLFCSLIILNRCSEAELSLEVVNDYFVMWLQVVQEPDKKLNWISLASKASFKCLLLFAQNFLLIIALESFVASHWDSLHELVWWYMTFEVLRVPDLPYKLTKS